WRLPTFTIEMIASTPSVMRWNSTDRSMFTERVTALSWTTSFRKGSPAVTRSRPTRNVRTTDTASRVMYWAVSLMVASRHPVLGGDATRNRAYPTAVGYGPDAGTRSGARLPVVRR